MCVSHSHVGKVSTHPIFYWLASFAGVRSVDWQINTINDNHKRTVKQIGNAIKTQTVNKYEETQVQFYQHTRSNTKHEECYTNANASKQIKKYV